MWLWYANGSNGAGLLQPGLADQASEQGIGLVVRGTTERLTSRRSTEGGVVRFKGGLFSSEHTVGVGEGPRLPPALVVDGNPLEGISTLDLRMIMRGGHARKEVVGG